MCGIVGVISESRRQAELQALVRRMAASLEHRGPDGEGYVTEGNCALGFRRLAIVDLAADAMPFASEDRAVWSVANAEIYNHAGLREDMQARGHVFQTDVDTEVLSHLYEESGADLVHQLNGMFAFAIWDARRKRLLLARDRAGEKPLFYWAANGEFAFASEMRALLLHPEVQRAVNPVAVRRYLLHDYFPAPLTPIAGIRKLPAGHLLLAQEAEISVRPYWDLARHFASPELASRHPEELCNELHQRIGAAVRRRSRSDVPVGIYLSGGIDSSTLLAHAAEQQGPGVPVFALGHTDDSFDESRFARDTADYFEADFNRLIVDETDLAEGLRMVGEGLDEPLGDASLIPSVLLARFASAKVKVVLSGEGADELFAGYPTYAGSRMADLFCRLPRAVREALIAGARRFTPVTMGNVGLDYLLSRFSSGADRNLVERHHTWFGSLGPERHPGLLSSRMMEALEGDDPFTEARARVESRVLPDDLSRLLYTDFTMYLQDDLLTKVDRATMLASLEARAPFLDHDLAEFVAGLPSREKLRGLTTKAILRRTMRRKLPPGVLRRRKRGFNIPFSRWLLHGLGRTMRRRFSPERVEARGLFSQAGIRRLLDEHLSRQADHRKPLFTLLVLDLWCDKIFGDSTPIPLTSGAPALQQPVS